MDDALLVRGLERLGDLHARARAPRRPAAARAAMPLGQRLALDQLHHQEAACRPDGSTPWSVAMCGWFSAASTARLALEALADCGSRDQLRGRTLIATVAAEPGVAGAVHLAHAAGAEGVNDFVRAEPSPAPRGIRPDSSCAKSGTIGAATIARPRKFAGVAELVDSDVCALERRDEPHTRHDLLGKPVVVGDEVNARSCRAGKLDGVERGLITGPPDGCIVSHGLCVERQDRADVAEGASVVWLNAHPKLTTAVGQCKQRVVGP